MTKDVVVLYFAYGSNMFTKRLKKRISSAHPIGNAVLSDYEFICNKKSKDGSSKGNIIPRKGTSTWGVLYEIPITDLQILDEVEGGYKRITVNVIKGKQNLSCETYISQNLSNALPYDWYMNYIIEGALENDLPKEYILSLSQIKTKIDKKKECNNNK